MVKQAVIIAAGHGSRFGDHFDREVFSKPLISLGGTALIDWVINALKFQGIKEFVVVVGYHADVLRAHLDKRDDVQIQYADNPDWQRPNGISLAAAEPYVRGEFLVLMSDHVFNPGLVAPLLAATLAPHQGILLTDPATKDIFDVDDATKVKVEGDLIVNIGKEISEFDAIDTGIFRFSPDFFAVLRECIAAGRCSLSDGVRHLASKRMMRSQTIEKLFWQDVDTLEALALAEQNVHLLFPK